MQALLTLSLLAGLLFQPASKQANRPAIKVTASVDTTAPEEQPILDVHLINQSGHTMHIPDPPLLCTAAPGALSLEVKFVPEKASQPKPATDCDLEVDGSGLPDIRERAKTWLTLKSGQDYDARRPISMGVDANARGTYELWVVYNGPCASQDDLQKLEAAGIAAPCGRFQSEKLTYKISTPPE